MCQNCGYNSPKYLGRCPNCGSWSSFVEEVEVAEVKNARVSLTGEKRQKEEICDRLAACIFEKRRASCFTNPDLKDFLEGNGAKSIEFIGVDGNGCVKASVLAAVKENYQVSVDLSAVGVVNQKKFQQTLHKWHSARVTVEGELS